MSTKGQRGGMLVIEASLKLLNAGVSVCFVLLCVQGSLKLINGLGSGAQARPSPRYMGQKLNLLCVQGSLKLINGLGSGAQARPSPRYMGQKLKKKFKITKKQNLHWVGIEPATFRKKKNQIVLGRPEGGRTRNMHRTVLKSRAGIEFCIWEPLRSARSMENELEKLFALISSIWKSNAAKLEPDFNRKAFWPSKVAANGL